MWMQRRWSVYGCRKWKILKIPQNFTLIYFISGCLKLWHKVTKFHFYCKWILAPDIIFQPAWFLIINIGIGPEKAADRWESCRVGPFQRWRFHHLPPVSLSCSKMKGGGVTWKSEWVLQQRDKTIFWNAKRRWSAINIIPGSPLLTASLLVC